MTGLQKQTISINLGTGIDTKTDEKAANPNDFKSIKNCRLNKLKRLDKRFGTDRLPTSLQTNFTNNPLTIGSSNIKSQVIAHEDQLLLQNKGALYSYLEDQEKWQFKGHYYPVDIESSVVQSNEYDLINPFCGQIQGYTIVAYFAVLPTRRELRFSLIEQATGNYIAEDQVVESNNSNLALNYPRVITFSNKAYIGWQEANSLKIREVNFLTGALGSVLTLQTNARSFGSFQAAWEFSVTNKSGVGERAFISYLTSANVLTVFAITSAGVIDATIGTYTQAGINISQGISVFYNSVGDYLSICYQEVNNIVSRRLRFTSSSITLLVSQNVLAQSASLVNFQVAAIVQCEDPVTAANTNVFFDRVVETGYNQAFSRDNWCHRGVVNDSSVVLSGTIIGYSLQIAAKPIVDTVRQTIYLPMAYISSLQASCVMVDVLKGKNEAGHYVLAKWNYGTYDEISEFTLSPCINQSTGKYFFTHEIRTRTYRPQGFSGLLDFQAYATGINLSTIDLFPEYAGSSSYIANASFLSGGYLGYYDGSQFYEQGFFQEAEMILAIQPGSDFRVTFNVIQQGSGVLPEITQVFCLDAQLQLPGAVGTNYWTFNTTTATVNVYYIINGVGVSPGAAGTNVGVSLVGNETASEVARKTILALQALLFDFTITRSFSYNTFFTITNNANGAVTDASNANYQSVLAPMSAGTRAYAAVFYAIDARGQIIRSRPTANYNVVTTNSRPVSITVSAPPITNREVVQLKVELYRTVNNGTILRKLTTFPTDPSFNLNGYSINYLDITTDANLGDEQIYTTGDVLSNYSIPACRAVTTFKNRLLAVVNDLNFPLYSKSALPGEAIEMAEENQLVVSFDEGKVVGLKQLDDKLIIGKPDKLFYVAGDGSNDLGQNSSFTLPTLIASDVGVLNQNSMEINDLGMMFNSDKGIYLLSRSLQSVPIGRPADDFKENKVSKALLIKTDSQMRFVYQDIDQALVYDYIDNLWKQFEPYGADDACIWKNQFVRVNSSGFVFVENKTIFIDSNSAVESYAQSIETHWLKIKNLQDYQRIYRAAFLGELKSASIATMKIYYDYDESSFDTYVFNSSEVTTGSQVYQFMMHLKQQKCEALKLSISIATSTGTEEGVTLTDMAFDVGMKRGLNKLSAERKL